MIQPQLNTVFSNIALDMVSSSQQQNVDLDTGVSSEGKIQALQMLFIQTLKKKYKILECTQNGWTRFQYI